MLDAGVVAGAAVAVFIGEMRQPARRAAAQIVDGRKPALVLEKFGDRVAPGVAAAMAVMSSMDVPNPIQCSVGGDYSAAGAIKNG